MPFKILSIDGGGLRGIMAIEALKWIEKKTGSSLLNNFDLFAGTSTGGLIVAALTVTEKKDYDGLTPKPKYSIESIEELYKRYGSKIFPPSPKFQRYFHKVKNIYRPRYTEKGLHEVLDDYLDPYRLTDCIRPVLITTYDLIRSKPIYFTSRSIYESSPDYNSNSNINAQLTKICRATSAAPVYLPSYSFMYADKDKNNYLTNCIDGGVYSNNPALTAYLDVLTNLNDPLYSKGQLIEEKDIHIVSIGTGHSNKLINHKQSKKWGIYNWGKTITDVMMQGNSQAVDYQLSKLLGYRYLRIDTDIAPAYANMTDSRSSTFSYLCDKLNKDVLSNDHFVDSFERFARLASIPFKKEPE